MRNVVRYKDKPAIPTLEKLIAKSVIKIQEIRGRYCCPKVVYDTIEEHRDLDPLGVATSGFNWDLDIIMLTEEPQEYEVNHEICHKFQYDYRIKERVNPDNSIAVETCILEGDAWLNFAYMASKSGTMNRKTHFALNLLSKVIYCLGLIHYLNGKFKRDELLVDLGKEGMRTARGTRYMQKLDKLGGLELVNFALLYEHGNKLTPPKKLLREYKSKSWCHEKDQRLLKAQNEAMVDYIRTKAKQEEIS